LNCVLKTFCCSFSQVSFGYKQLNDTFLLVKQTDKDFHKLSSETSPS